MLLDVHEVFLGVGELGEGIVGAMIYAFEMWCFDVLL
jgi:hypothetical protein